MPRALLHGNERYFTDSVSQRFSLVMPSEPLLRPRLAWPGLLCFCEILALTTVSGGGVAAGRRNQTWPLPTSNRCELGNN